MTLWYVPSDGSAATPIVTQTATALTGAVTFANFFTDTTYAISAQPNGAGGVKYVLDDTVHVVEGWGGVTQEADQCQLQGNAGCSTFAYKYAERDDPGLRPRRGRHRCRRHQASPITPRCG